MNDANKMRFDLEFVSADTPPTKEGDVVLYNQCDGYHLAFVRAWANGGGLRFCTFMGDDYPVGYFCAYAYLPGGDERINAMYEAFARKPKHG